MNIKNFINSIEKYICFAMLAISLVLLCVQVALRTIGLSILWAEEIARYLFIYLIYLGGSFAASSSAHIVLEIAMAVWPKKIRPYVKLLGNLIWLTFLLWFTIACGQYVLNLHQSGAVSVGSRNYSLAVLFAAMPIGYGATCIRVVQAEIIPQIKKIRDKSAWAEKAIPIDLDEGGIEKP